MTFFDTEDTTMPVCPNETCTYKIDDEQLWYHEDDIEIATGDGDESIYKCPVCGIEILVTCSHHIKFTTSEKEADYTTNHAALKQARETAQRRENEE